MATRTGTADGAVGPRTLVVRGVLAVAGSLLANWLVLGVVLAADLVEPVEQLSVPPVTLLTAAGAVGATAVYALLRRISDRPDWTFAVVATVALLLSFLPDVALLEADPAATVPAVTVLMLMHATVAVVCVAALTDLVGVPGGRAGRSSG